MFLILPLVVIINWLYCRYVFTVMAVDENQPMLRSEVPVTVAIDDVNDQSPVFEFPADDNRTFPVSSAVPPGFPIVTVDAHDNDAGENSRLSYELMSMSAAEQRPMFRINRYFFLSKIIWNLCTTLFTTR